MLIRMAQLTSDRDSIRFLPASPEQWEARQKLSTSRVLFFIGPPGTGKSHCAIGLALTEVFAGRCRQVNLVRPLVPAAGESLGYFKGGLEKKLGPWHEGVLGDVLNGLSGGTLKAQTLLQNGKLQILSLGLMRGRTLEGISILDEAQNATLPQFKLFLSRLSRLPSARLILCGDPEQSDLPRHQACLLPLANSVAHLPGVSVIRFKAEQTQRDPLTVDILEAIRHLE